MSIRDFGADMGNVQTSDPRSGRRSSDYESGYNAGWNDRSEAIENDVAKRISNFLQCVEGVKAARQEIYSDVVRQILVSARELADDSKLTSLSQYLSQIFEEHPNLLESRSVFKISPDDFDMLERLCDGDLAPSERVRTLFEPSEEVQFGTVCVEQDGGLRCIDVESAKSLISDIIKDALVLFLAVEEA